MKLYAVRTTGIVCRVGCASRAPRPENVEYFADLAQARAAGYRPCKRCRPERVADDLPQAIFERHLVEQARALLHAGHAVAETAARLHVSERHLRRVVRARTGLTPRELAA